MAAVLARPELAGALHGFVFRLTLDMSPWETAAMASAMAADLGVAASLHLRMFGANPAEETADDHLTVNRIAEAMAGAAAYPNVTIFGDTLMDIDRGYFPRAGVLDRMYNPRPGFHLVRHMNAALNRVKGDLSPGATGDCPGGRYVQLQADTGTITLALPDTGTTEISVPIAGNGEQIDLSSGEISSVEVGGDRTVNVAGTTLIIPV